MQSAAGLTNWLWDFFEGLLAVSQLTPEQLATMRNPNGKPGRIVPFIAKDDLEERATVILRDLAYEDGLVSLDAICALETARCGLVVINNFPRELSASGNPLLGRITFAPLEIRIYEQAVPNLGRERFTLAHELAHHLLSHSDYIAQESCDEGDFSLLQRGSVLGPDIARIEYQANYLAACLLMPKAAFIADFLRIVKWIGIANKGFGALYLDDQPCNFQNYATVTHELMKHYAVSRAAATIRLQSLGLLRDVRIPKVSKLTADTSWLRPSCAS